MRNRAKCKLCKAVIESFHSTDLVVCECGEISVDGGEGLRCAARNWSNFLRVDDDDNEILVSVKGDVNPLDISSKPKKEELLKMLDNMIENIEKLPEHVMSNPINHYDYNSLLILLSAIFRSEED